MSCWTHFFPPPKEFPTQEVVQCSSLDPEGTVSGDNDAGRPQDEEDTPAEGRGGLLESVHKAQFAI